MLPFAVPLGLFHDSSLWFSMLSCMLRGMSGWLVMHACFIFKGVSIRPIHYPSFFSPPFWKVYVHIILSFFIFLVFFFFFFFLRGSN
jgi:hypothetical protein